MKFNKWGVRKGLGSNGQVKMSTTWMVDGLNSIEEAVQWVKDNLRVDLAQRIEHGRTWGITFDAQVDGYNQVCDIWMHA